MKTLFTSGYVAPFYLFLAWSMATSVRKNGKMLRDKQFLFPIKSRKGKTKSLIIVKFNNLK